MSQVCTTVSSSWAETTLLIGRAVGAISHRTAWPAGSASSNAASRSATDASHSSSVNGRGS